ncbi:hypothetical protein [Staphylococcus epidermidis]|uniref:hypothetical protein n=1 Tax=Staphylococcus epidermidis TaxID=1282 RepID=UPI001642B6B2|nr:hypothetical protein [Staphylococcus epidermidis]
MKDIMLKEGEEFRELVGVQENKLVGKYVVVEMKDLKEVKRKKLIKEDMFMVE